MSISRNKPLLFIIGILLITNIALLLYFLNDREPRHSGEKMTGRSGMISGALKSEVGFNDDQIAEYRKIKEEHFKTMRPMMDDIRRFKDSLFRLMGTDSNSDSLVEGLADEVAMRQKQMDLLAFSHFRKVRQLCTPEQLPKYDSLVMKMIRKMGRPGKGEQSAKARK